MEDLELKTLRSEGWILAPGEDKKKLLERKALLESLPKESPKDYEEKAHKITHGLYDFSLKQIPILYSSKSLSPWQGAVLWIYSQEDGTEFPTIQMREKFNGILRFYKPEEILAHELVHAARFAFKEPFFEEILAYKTSNSKLRSFFGPLFIYPLEATIFVGLGLLCPLAFLFSEMEMFLWIPSAFFLLLLLRLCLLQGIFKLAFCQLRRMGEEKPLSSLVHLSDSQILFEAFLFFKRRKRTIF
jgi:hypothetical protein